MHNCNGILVIEMINDGGLSFETQLEIEFFHQIMVVKKGLETFLHSKIKKKW